jgi:hypothetical protein
MITTAIAVNTDGATVLSAGATYGILLAILFGHGIVCSAATNILARLNLFYVLVNGEFYINLPPRVQSQCVLSRHDYRSNYRSAGLRRRQ